GHTTMLLGAARYLAQHRDFDGTVYFIFQPAEEGEGGGRQMVEEGLFERFPMQAVYGMHNMARLGLGWDALQAANPRLVLCSISGYGQHGPYAQYAGHDINYLAMAGMLHPVTHS